MQGLIHRHRHKRKLAEIHDGKQTRFWIKFLDRATVAAGILGPLMVIPQIVKIFSTHNATGVSAVSWFAFGILDIPFLFYGIIHKEKPIIITYTLFMIANFTVAIGAMLYH